MTHPTQADEAKTYGPVIEVPLRELDSGTLASMVTALRTQLADAQKQLAAIKEGADFTGCFTGLTDCAGNKVYFGDTLDFDPKEWGGPYQFVVEYDPQDLFRANDIKSWCTKIQATRQPTQDKGGE